jgi:membrane protein
MRICFTSLPKLLKRTYIHWSDNKGSRLGAALAFYSSLSIGPLLVLLIAIGQLFWSKEVITGHITHQIQALVGDDAVFAITSMLTSAHAEQGGLIATLISSAVLLISASGVFYELQDALNTIWQVPAKENQPFLHVITDRFLSFAMVLGTGFLLLISLVLSTALSIMTAWFSPYAAYLGPFAIIMGWGLSFVITALLFAMIFKMVPDKPIQWHEVWPGAFLTALLFDGGKWFISFYLSHSAVKSSYGAAGSLMVFLIWVYYSAQILYFGAEFTKTVTEEKSAG